MTLVWALLVGWVYRARKGDPMGALWVGLCVVSHWVLDWISHRPDLPLYPGGGPKLGLGLWYSVPATLLVEGLLFATGIWIYIATTRAKDRVGSIAFWVLMAVLAGLYAMASAAPPPPNMKAIAITDIALVGIFAWAAWADRHRALRAAPVALSATAV